MKLNTNNAFIEKDSETDPSSFDRRREFITNVLEELEETLTDLHSFAITLYEC